MKNDVIYIIVIVILLLSTILMYNKISNMSKRFDDYENTIGALNDTIRKTIHDGFVVYDKKTPEIDLKELMNSEYFKTLSKEQKEFYKELKGIKGLISSTKAQLNKQGSLIDELLASNTSAIIDSNRITFVRGDSLKFKEKDTTKALQYTASVKLDSIIDFKMNYDYNVNIQTNFERQKDKSILVKYKIDDPELTVSEMYNFTIPAPTPKNGFDRWYQNNRRTINIIGGAILVGAGGFVGYSIAK